MTVAEAFAAVNVLGMLRGPMRWLPMFMSQLMEFQVSMNRIQKYLLCPEPKVELVDKKETESDLAIRIKKSNYSWGG
jgi:hypothetical protein